MEALLSPGVGRHSCECLAWLGLAGGTWPIHSQGGKLAKAFIFCPKWMRAQALRVGGQCQPPHSAGWGPLHFYWRAAEFALPEKSGAVLHIWTPPKL